VNVYCFGLLQEKKLVWEEIGAYRSTQLLKAWCVIGDFNFMRSREERRSLISMADFSR